MRLGPLCSGTNKKSMAKQDGEERRKKLHLCLTAKEEIVEVERPLKEATLVGNRSGTN